MVKFNLKRSTKKGDRLADAAAASRDDVKVLVDQLTQQTANVNTVAAEQTKARAYEKAKAREAEKAQLAYDRALEEARALEMKMMDATLNSESEKNLALSKEVEELKKDIEIANTQLELDKGIAQASEELQRANESKIASLEKELETARASARTRDMAIELTSEEVNANDVGGEGSKDGDDEVIFQAAKEAQRINVRKINLLQRQYEKEVETVQTLQEYLKGMKKKLAEQEAESAGQIQTLQNQVDSLMTEMGEDVELKIKRATQSSSSHEDTEVSQLDTFKNVLFAQTEQLKKWDTAWMRDKDKKKEEKGLIEELGLGLGLWKPERRSKIDMLNELQDRQNNLDAQNAILKKLEASMKMGNSEIAAMATADARDDSPSAPASP